MSLKKSLHKQGFGNLCRKKDGHLTEVWMERGLAVFQIFVSVCAYERMYVCVCAGVFNRLNFFFVC